MIFRFKKGIMGIGMLMIFIATILVSAAAAGVLIRSTGILQERALVVEQSARERLVHGIEIFSIYINGNQENETFNELEFYARTRAGSPPIQMRTLGLSFISGNMSFSAGLNESKIGTEGQCSFGSLTPETEFCFENRIGNNDTILEEGELLVLRYKLSDENVLPIETIFEVAFLPKKGALENIELRTPDMVLNNKLRLR